MQLNSHIPTLKKSKRLVLLSAVKLHNAGDLVNAKKEYQKLYKSHPNYPELRASIAKICAELSHYEDALYYSTEDLKNNPTDPAKLTNLAYIQLQLGLINDAEKNIALAIDINPKRIESYFIKASVLAARGDDQAALKVSLHALSIDPTSSNALNNLGTTLRKLGDLDSAKIAFESACILNPNIHEPFFNLAAIEALKSNPQKAIELYKQSLNKTSYTSADIVARVNYALGFELLKIGQLSEAWEMLEFGFHPSIPFEYQRSPNRTFPVPRWTGEPLNGQRLLIWGEQGIGDEVLFLTCLPDLNNIDGYILVECEQRLVESLSRSFPKIIFRPSSYRHTLGLPPVFDDYNLHIPMGSLMRIFRNDISDFRKSKPYIVVDSKKANYYEGLLNRVCASRKRIGICWRSGKLSGQRNVNYTSLLDWGSIFSLPNSEFINLQYGECEQELLEAEEKFGIRILRWPDLDLKIDIDSTFALMSRLDIVVSIDSAVTPMAAAVGLRVLLMGPKEWHNLGTNFYPWFSNIECVFPQLGGIVAECLSIVSNQLAKESIGNPPLFQGSQK